MKKKVSEKDLWSVKEIIIWARRHAYTPFFSISDTERSSVKESMKSQSYNEPILSTCTEPVDLNKWLSESSKNNLEGNQDFDSDVEIDIISQDTENGNLRC